VCVFRNWAGVTEDQTLKVTTEQHGSAHAMDVMRKASIVLKPNAETRQTGVMLNISLRLSDQQSNDSGSLFERLGDIKRLAGSADTQEVGLLCVISKGAGVQPVTSVELGASMPDFLIFERATLHDVVASLSFSRVAGKKSDKPAPLDITLELHSRLELGIFDEHDPWESDATLTLKKSSHRAELVVLPTTAKEQGMIELGAIKLNNIQLHVTYDFAPPSNASAVTSSISLSATVVVAGVSTSAMVLFDGTRPLLLFFAIPGTVDIAKLFKDILADDFPPNFPQISFSKLHFSYSWKSSDLVLLEVPDNFVGEVSKAFPPGFCATATTSLFGK
jgi:hypothetical protein